MTDPEPLADRLKRPPAIVRFSWFVVALLGGPLVIFMVAAFFRMAPNLGFPEHVVLVAICVYLLALTILSVRQRSWSLFLAAVLPTVGLCVLILRHGINVGLTRLFTGRHASLKLGSVGIVVIALLAAWPLLRRPSVDVDES